ncbi:MAG: prepilin-type N-terminal cleavage/methylation domain-containing protein [Alphaproteobacteria bacterium]
MKNSKVKAFTLIELSVVLIIIGLIISAIVAGNELISQARVRGVIREVQSIQTSINTFKLKFDYLPGDFPKAGAIWTSATCANSNATAGCNGNGDYIIPISAGTNGSEGYRVWQHLSLSGLMNAEYTGTSAMTDQFKSSYAEGGYIIVRYTSPFASSLSYNFLEMGGWNGTLSTNGLLTPVDAYGLDSKMDDGIANKGKLFGIDGSNISGGRCSYPVGSTNGLPNYNILGTQGAYCRMKIMTE